jgi:hypothetical protein
MERIMGKINGHSGGGIESRQTSMTRAPKTEPVNHPVDMRRPSMIGLAHYINQDKGALYQHRGVDSTPKGPNHNFAVGPGAGRQILPSGSQSSVKAPTPMGRGRSLFK